MLDKLILSEEAIDFIESNVQDDLNFSAEQVFFFGEVYDDMPDAENDDYPKAYCPVCGELFKLKKRPKPRTYDDIFCPHCGQEGILYDFRDKNLPLNDYMPLYIAYLESLDKGYVLRLFEVGLDYSRREYDDYTKLSHYPDMYVKETGREYWYEDKIEYYENLCYQYGEEDFVQCKRLDDTDFNIINFDYDKTSNPMIDTQYIGDILYELNVYKDGLNFIEVLSKKLSYKTLSTLKKYGFDKLAEDYCYNYDILPKSNKISEILGVDYNQLIAYNDPTEFTMEDLNNAQRLAAYNLKLTSENLTIISRLNTDILNNFDKHKTFKYLRNLMSKYKSSNAVKDYNDYISDCIKLKLDITANDIRYPSKFMEVHTRYAMLIEEEKDKTVYSKFESVIKSFATINSFQTERFIVRLAQSPAELRAEGKILNHCVGGYADRVCKGNCLIFFIRNIEEPEIPFYTLEYDPKRNEIVQCRGYRNCNYTENENITNTVIEWEKWVTAQRKSKSKAA